MSAPAEAHLQFAASLERAMRVFGLCLLLLAMAGAASAQELTPDQGLGPYRFGMSAVEARATAPSASWTSEPEGELTVLSGGPDVVIAGRMSAALVFRNDALTRLVLVGRTPGDCVGAVANLVESVEPLYGAFISMGPYVLEEGELTRTVRTSAGSEVRVLEREDGAVLASSARYGAVYALAQGRVETGAGGEHCRVTMTVGHNSEWPRSGEGPGPTWNDLDNAESLVAPHWVRRPTAENFAHVYPGDAIQRGLGGKAVLDCLVAEQGRLNCRVSHEEPSAEGFGRAALELAAYMRVQRGEDGTPALNRRVRVPIRFRIF
jgi:TonB family protein